MDYLFVMSRKIDQSNDLSDSSDTCLTCFTQFRRISMWPYVSACAGLAPGEEVL